MGLATADKKKADPKKFEKIMAVFRREKPDGSYYYSSADIEHWIPIMLISLGDPASTWTADNQRIFGAFLEKLGVRDASDGNAILKKVAAYYKKNPVNPELLQALSQVALDVKLDASEATARKAANVLKSAGSANLGAQGGMAAPKGGGAGLGGKRR